MKQKSRIPLLIIVIAVIVAVGIDVVVQVRREMVLQGFFTNDDENLFPAEKIQKAYAETLNLSKRQTINFEDSLYIVLGSSKDYPAASASKIMAYAASKELDFVVTTAPIVAHYQTGFALEDLRNLTDPSLAKYLIYGEDGNHQEMAVAIDMTESRFIQGKHTETPYYLFVPANSRRKEAVRRFIAWAFDYSK